MGARTKRRGAGPPWLLAVALLLPAGGVGCSGPTAPDPGRQPPDTTAVAPPQDSTVGAWQPAPAMPGPRMRHAAAVYRGDLVVAGGVVGPGEFTESVIRLPPGGVAWEELAPLPLQLGGLSLVVVADTLFAVGGDGPFFARPEQALLAYRPDADEWVSRSDVPDWRVSTEAVEIDGSLWLTGGPVVRSTEHGPLVPADTILRYAPAEGAWRYEGVLPVPRYDHEVVQDPSGRTYLVGGEHGLFPRVFPGVDVYDPATGAWLSLDDPLPTRRIAAAFADPYVHVVGGDEYRDFHRALDTRTGDWLGLPKIPQPLEWPKLVAWEGALWLVGGYRTTESGGREIIAEVWRLDLDEVGVPAPATPVTGGGG